MADPSTEALQKRIATLEAQVAALLQAISADRGGNVVINAPGSLTISVVGAAGSGLPKSGSGTAGLFGFQPEQCLEISAANFSGVK